MTEMDPSLHLKYADAVINKPKHDKITAKRTINNTLALLVVAAVFVAVLACLILAMGPSYIMAPWDVFTLLDEAWRILCGQIAHTDFHNPIGPLTYSLIALGMKIGGVSLAGYTYGNVLFLLVVSLWGGAIFFGRMRPAYALLLTLFVAILSVATRPLGYPPSVTSYAMIYNRYGWILLAMAVVQLFVEPNRDSTNKSRFDAFSVGLLLGFIFYCKISYFVFGAAGLVLAAVLRPPFRKAAPLSALGFVLVCIGTWFTLGVNPADYVSDVLAAGRAQSIDARFWHLIKALVQNFWQIPLAGVVWFLLAAEPASRSRTPRAGSLKLSAVYFFILGTALVLTVSNAVERSDVPLFFVAGIILLQQAERTWNLAPLTEIKKRNWKYIASAAIIVLGFFANIVVKDIWSIGNSLIGSARVATAENEKQRFDAPRLHDFLIPAASEWETSYWEAEKVPEAINDGLQLIRRHIDKNDRIVVLALTDPFSFALGLIPPEGIPVWWDVDFSFNANVHPSDEQIFGKSDFVLYPRLRASDEGCCQENVKLLLRIYGGSLKRDFAEVERSKYWVLLRRTHG
jgi:hypothetical protein